MIILAGCAPTTDNDTNTTSINTGSSVLTPNTSNETGMITSDNNVTNKINPTLQEDLKKASGEVVGVINEEVVTLISSQDAVKAALEFVRQSSTGTINTGAYGTGGIVEKASLKNQDATAIREVVLKDKSIITIDARTSSIISSTK
jgi:hypothetical protein